MAARGGGVKKGKYPRELRHRPSQSAPLTESSPKLASDLKSSGQIPKKMMRLYLDVEMGLRRGVLKID